MNLETRLNATETNGRVFQVIDSLSFGLATLTSADRKINGDANIYSFISSNNESGLEEDKNY